MDTCTCCTRTPRRSRSTGDSVFDSMLSEWLISQCFDLLQLLELCLVRALDLTHFTECNVAALYSALLLLPVFLLKRQFLCLKDLIPHMVILHTRTQTHTVTNRFYNQAFVELKQKMQCVILLQFLYGYYWIVIIITFRFSFCCTESPVWLQQTLWILHESFEFIFGTWFMLVHKTM